MTDSQARTFNAIPANFTACNFGHITRMSGNESTRTDMQNLVALIGASEVEHTAGGMYRRKRKAKQ